MKKINLRIHYPSIYSDDAYLEVSDEIAFVMDDFRAKEASAIRKKYRYCAQFSLDVGDGIENEIAVDIFIQIEQSEKQSDRLITALDQLTDIQRRRIEKHFFQQQTLSEIAAEEHVSISSVQESIDSAVTKMKKHL